MRTLIVGAWQAEETQDVTNVAKAVGRILAERGHTLISGSGNGIAHLVAESYKSAGGAHYVKFLPAESAREYIGEPVGFPADETIDTNEDYAVRNIKMVQSCDSVIAIRGGLRTLNELIIAAVDYHRPIAVFDSGDIAAYVRGLPPLHKRVTLTKDAADTVSALEESYAKKRSP